MRLPARIVLALLLVHFHPTPTPGEIVGTNDVRRHVGAHVTVEGDVQAVTVDANSIVLDLASSDPSGFRAVLVRSLVSSIPGDPARIYERRRVRVTGLVQRFAGRPEMVLESPSQIEIVDVADAPPSPPAARPPTPAAGVAPAPSTVTTVPTPTTTLPAPTPATTLSDRLRTESCARARTRWDEAAAAVRKASGAFERCVSASPHRCRDAAAAIAPTLADFEWAEQAVAERCP